LATHSGCPIAWHATETWSDNSKSPGGCTAVAVHVHMTR
jgi:hypothetical protein